MIREVLFGDLFLHWRFVSRTHCGQYTISTVGQIVPCLLLPSFVCNDANTWSQSASVCAGSGDEMVPCLALVEKISDNPVHFIASERDLFPPSHKLGTRTEPMNTANYHICKHAHIRKWSQYLHSKILTSAPGPALALALALLWDSVATNPKRWPPAVCQIQESFSCVELGSFGFTIAVLALTSSGVKTLNWDWVARSAPSRRSCVWHWL